MPLTVIVLTRNEARHITRALTSVAPIADRLLVVDSGSTDETVMLAREAGADVLIHPFVTQAQQFNWALEQLSGDTEWVLRIDADEIVTKSLAEEILNRLGGLAPHINGVYFSRRMTFLGRAIRWGGVFPIRILRLFRFGHGRCENRWMDEHIIVDGHTVNFVGEIIDDNLSTLSAWTEKHNAYASREVVDLLNREHGFMRYCEGSVGLRGARHVSLKRWIKENIYGRLPGGFRALIYFIYRYFLRLGFLDGRQGTAFHILQGFWYRYLVDTKLYEVKSYMRRNDVDAVKAIREVLGINITRE
jgi:glycosyltransferase involved in cell wall biosynthesis